MLDVSIYLLAGKNKTLTLVRMLWGKHDISSSEENCD
jgi:hypothetical protein